MFEIGFVVLKLHVTICWLLFYRILGVALAMVIAPEPVIVPTVTPLKPLNSPDLSDQQKLVLGGTAPPFLKGTFPFYIINVVAVFSLERRRLGQNRNSLMFCNPAAILLTYFPCTHIFPLSVPLVKGVTYVDVGESNRISDTKVIPPPLLEPSDPVF